MCGFLFYGKNEMRKTRHTSGLGFYEDKTPLISMRLVHEIIEWVLYTVLAVFFAIVLVRAFGQRVVMKGKGMESGIVSGQNVFVNKLAYRMKSPEAGDVVVFYPGGNKQTQAYIRRVAAGPGDTVRILDGKLLVNGIPAAGSSAYGTIEDAGIAASLITLGDNEYFVLGDHPGESEDSRSAGIGVVRETDITGSAWLALPCHGGSLHFIH